MCSTYFLAVLIITRKSVVVFHPRTFWIVHLYKHVQTKIGMRVDKEKPGSTLRVVEGETNYQQIVLERPNKLVLILFVLTSSH